MPTLVVVASLAIFGLAMLTSGLTGARSVSHHEDDFRLRSAVESVAMLATEDIWSGYLQANGGAATSIESFRTHMDNVGVADMPNVNVPPGPNDGIDYLGLADIPGAGVGNPEFNNVNVDSLRLVRRDVGDSTQLYLTVSASTNRGQGIVNPVLNRAIQVVYTVEPEDFEGFDYGILANNVNCIFCHTQVDSVDRFWNTDTSEYGEFDKVKVGTLESLMIRHNMWGDDPNFLSDLDADSAIAGTLYVRGEATDHSGNPITDWSDLSLGTLDFDPTTGKIIEDQWGNTQAGTFTPAGDPPQPGENLYLDYPTDYTQMVDGNLPPAFPPPIPDDGGGVNQSLAGNRIVDDEEFDAEAATAEGAITAGIINITDHGEVYDDVVELADGIFTGNTASVQKNVDGNMILTGTRDNPITIDGKVTIDGDLIISGYVKGEGSLVVRGNVYVPTDLQYLDGSQYMPGDPIGSPTGPRTFGVAQDGTTNALGLASGGNIMIGDYQRSSSFKPNGWDPPSKYEVVAGDESGEFSFVLAQLSLFNRGEWSKTQPLLPGPGENGLPDPDPSTPANEAWTVVNPDYDANHIPRYYGYGDGDSIPIYNKGNLYYDELTATWHGDEEVPLEWDLNLITLADPTDPNDALLFDGSGNPTAVISQLEPNGGWMPELMYKVAVEYFEDIRPDFTSLKFDGLLYTNNAIFGIVNRIGNTMRGQMQVNGSLVAADLGLLVAGWWDPANQGNPENTPNSPWRTGLQLNYDLRTKDLLNVKNPFQVQLKRTLWDPTRNIQ